MDAELSTRLNDFSCGLFFMFQIVGTFALYIKGRQHRLQRSAFFFMLYLLAISVFEFYVFFIHNFLGENMRSITDLLQVTVVPLALFFLYRLTHNHYMPLGMAVVNGGPYLLAFAAYVFTLQYWIYEWTMGVALIHSVLIIGYGFFAVRQFNRQLSSNFSSEEHLSLHWLWLFLFLYILLGVVWFIATKIYSPITASVYNVLCSIILGLLCYFVYRQEDMLEMLHGEPAAEERDVQEHDEAEVEEEKAMADFHFSDRFEEIFRKQKLYLNPTLNINDVARAMGTNRTYISVFLNRRLNTTFYDYVNRWRVEKAEELLSSTELPLADIALQSGFNSMSSFHRNFQRVMGMTATEYRKSKKVKR